MSFTLYKAGKISGSVDSEDEAVDAVVAKSADSYGVDAEVTPTSAAKPTSNYSPPNYSPVPDPVPDSAPAKPIDNTSPYRDAVLSYIRANYEGDFSKVLDTSKPIPTTANSRQIAFVKAARAMNTLSGKNFDSQSIFWGGKWVLVSEAAKGNKALAELYSALKTEKTKIEKYSGVNAPSKTRAILPEYSARAANPTSGLVGKSFGVVEDVMTLAGRVIRGLMAAGGKEDGLSRETFAQAMAKENVDKSVAEQTFDNLASMAIPYASIPAKATTLPWKAVGKIFETVGDTRLVNGKVASTLDAVKTVGRAMQDKPIHTVKQATEFVTGQAAETIGGLSKIEKGRRLAGATGTSAIESAFGTGGQLALNTAAYEATNPDATPLKRSESALTILIANTVLGTAIGTATVDARRINRLGEAVRGNSEAVSTIRGSRDWRKAYFENSEDAIKSVVEALKAKKEFVGKSIEQILERVKGTPELIKSAFDEAMAKVPEAKRAQLLKDLDESGVSIFKQQPFTPEESALFSKKYVTAFDRAFGYSTPAPVKKAVDNLMAAKATGRDITSASKGLRDAVDTELSNRTPEGRATAIKIIKTIPEMEQFAETWIPGTKRAIPTIPAPIGGGQGVYVPGKVDVAPAPAISEKNTGLFVQKGEEFTAANAGSGQDIASMKKAVPVAKEAMLTDMISPKVKVGSGDFGLGSVQAKDRIYRAFEKSSMTEQGRAVLDDILKNKPISETPQAFVSQFEAGFQSIYGRAISGKDRAALEGMSQELSPLFKSQAEGWVAAPVGARKTATALSEKAYNERNPLFPDVDTPRGAELKAAAEFARDVRNGTVTPETAGKRASALYPERNKQYSQIIKDQRSLMDFRGLAEDLGVKSASDYALMLGKVQTALLNPTKGAPMIQSLQALENKYKVNFIDGLVAKAFDKANPTLAESLKAVSESGNGAVVGGAKSVWRLLTKPARGAVVKISEGVGVPIGAALSSFDQRKPLMAEEVGPFMVDVADVTFEDAEAKGYVTQRPGVKNVNPTIAEEIKNQALLLSAASGKDFTAILSSAADGVHKGLAHAQGRAIDWVPKDTAQRQFIADNLDKLIDSAKKAGIYLQFEVKTPADSAALGNPKVVVSPDATGTHIHEQLQPPIGRRSRIAP